MEIRLMSTCRWSILAALLLVAVLPRGDAHAQRPDLLIPPPPDLQIPPPPGAEFLRSQQLPETDLGVREERLREYLGRNPADEEATLELAAILLKTNRLQEALNLVVDASAANPSSFKLAMAVGQVYLEAGCFCSAIEQFEAIRWANPDQPDLNYWLSSAYLRGGLPLTAYWEASCYGPVTHQDVNDAQTLIRGSALAQLGLQCEAGALFGQVSHQAQNQALARRAGEIQNEMDEALCSRSRLYGVFALSERYDTNPGVLPTTNLFGIPLGVQPTWGNAFSGLVAYDIVRAYNFDLTAGYQFFGTANYLTSSFNLFDNAVFLNAQRRGLWGDYPYQAGLRGDYDHLLVDGNSFLQRGGVTPNITLYDSDFTSVSALFRYTRLDFLNQAVLDGTPRDADSSDYAVGLFRQHQSACRDISVQYGYLYDRNESEGADFRYHGNQLQAGFNWLTPWRDTQVSLLGSYYHRNYDNFDSIVLQGRTDVEYGVQTVVLYPLADSWYATFMWRLDRNDSTIGAYDYVRHTFDVGIQYNFGVLPDDVLTAAASSGLCRRVRS
jgi:tetratricopeptide (TPR) repeat protein